MKKTDYSKIAKIYDDNPVRHYGLPDSDLVKYISDTKLSSYNILDIACGTGNYLRFHIDYFKSEKINWHGIDLSYDMLKIARAKLPEVEFIEEDAACLSFEPDMFNYVANNLAFHHFEKKSKVLDEVARVLKEGGKFKVKDISPFEMQRFWVYQYFPSAYFEDLNRFWEPQLLFYELQTRGFQVHIQLDCKIEELLLEELLRDARKRDASQFAIISDEDYQEGIDRIKYDLKKKEKIVNEFCLMNCIAKKL